MKTSKKLIHSILTGYSQEEQREQQFYDFTPLQAPPERRSLSPWITAVIMAIIAAALILSSPEVSGQKYSIKNGTVVKDSTKTKTPDKVIKIIGKDTIFQGAKGGYYYHRVSKQTGKVYHSYIK